MATIRLVIPEEQNAGDSLGASVRRFAPGALRLGLLDNGKGNADRLLARIAGRLQGEIAVASLVSRRKPMASVPAKKEDLDALAGNADLVISAMAD